MYKKISLNSADELALAAIDQNECYIVTNYYLGEIDLYTPYTETVRFRDMNKQQKSEVINLVMETEGYV